MKNSISNQAIDLLPNYEELIDAETWEFIKQTESWYPSDAVSFSIQKQREVYNAMCKEFYQGYPAGVSASDSEIVRGGQSVLIRHYCNEKSSGKNAGACVVYFHGGGFVVGGLESHDDVCSEICDRTGFDVVSADYRLCPEFQHPAAFDDAMIVITELSASQNLPLVLCGDSAGGTLAAAVAHAWRGKNQNIVGQVLIYPGLGGDVERGTYITHANAPMLTTQDVKFYMNIRTGGKTIGRDATLAPLHDTQFNDLPPTIIFNAECDPLSGDGEAYCNAITRDGGKAVFHNEKGLVHGYLRARSTVGRAKESFSRITETVRMLGNRDW